MLTIFLNRYIKKYIYIYSYIPLTTSKNITKLFYGMEYLFENTKKLEMKYD